MLSSDVDNADDLADYLFELVQNEGSYVQIVHPNADFGGPNSTIYVTHKFTDTVQYFGESTTDCLKQAVTAYRSANGMNNCSDERNPCGMCDATGLDDDGFHCLSCEGTGTRATTTNKQPRQPFVDNDPDCPF